jgi:hypothetical protein
VFCKAVVTATAQATPTGPQRCVANIATTVLLPNYKRARVEVPRPFGRRSSGSGLRAGCNGDCLLQH